MADHRRPLVQQLNDASVLSGTLVRVTGEDSDGKVTVLGPNRLEPGWRGPALHSHAFEETFVVTSGTATFFTDEGQHEVEAGGLVHIPGGCPHSFANRSGEPAEIWTIAVPSGIEHFFAERDQQEQREGADLDDEANARLMRGRGATIHGDRPDLPTP